MEKLRIRGENWFTQDHHWGSERRGQAQACLIGKPSGEHTAIQREHRRMQNATQLIHVFSETSVYYCVCALVTGTCGGQHTTLWNPFLPCSCELWVCSAGVFTGRDIQLALLMLLKTDLFLNFVLCVYMGAHGTGNPGAGVEGSRELSVGADA